VGFPEMVNLYYSPLNKYPSAFAIRSNSTSHANAMLANFKQPIHGLDGQFC